MPDIDITPQPATITVQNQGLWFIASKQPTIELLGKAVVSAFDKLKNGWGWLPVIRKED